MGLCLLETTQRIENCAEVVMSLRVIRALLYRDAGHLKGFLVLCLIVQDYA